MSDKFQGKYRIKSARLQNWDYSNNGLYFVTICTANRELYFGDIVNGEMQLSEIGRMANKFWKEIPNHFLFVELDEFVIMPNHVHGIITINKSASVETRHALSLSTAPNETIGQQRFQNQGKGSLSAIIGSYKSVLTKNARKIHTDFTWQTRFHDHIVRDFEEYHRIEQYIQNNPRNWEDDCFYSK